MLSWPSFLFEFVQLGKWYDIRLNEMKPFHVVWIKSGNDWASLNIGAYFFKTWVPFTNNMN